MLGILIFVSCSKENKDTMWVKGNIKGLKKGTLYLQKQIDSLIVSVDSVHVNGTEEFILTDKVLSPEMYFLTLGNSDKRISFFGEKDSISISSIIDKYVRKAKITGSVNQDLLNEYYDIKKKFNNQNLDFIKAEFEAKRSGNNDSILLVQKKLNNLVKRRYLYTTNFAINKGDFEVAPYIALTELNNATLKLLDTVNNSLSGKIKKSKYGKQLEEFIQKIKDTEEN